MVTQKQAKRLISETRNRLIQGLTVQGGIPHTVSDEEIVAAIGPSVVNQVMIDHLLHFQEQKSSLKTVFRHLKVPPAATDVFFHAVAKIPPDRLKATRSGKNRKKPKEQELAETLLGVINALRYCLSDGICNPARKRNLSDEQKKLLWEDELTKIYNKAKDKALASALGKWGTFLVRPSQITPTELNRRPFQYGGELVAEEEHVVGVKSRWKRIEKPTTRFPLSIYEINETTIRWWKPKMRLLLGVVPLEQIIKSQLLSK